jgi:hypothetical protein
MSVGEVAPSLWEEIADLLTSDASPEEIVAFRPSAEVQQRVRELLHKSSAGELSADDERELLQFEQAELFMRLVKARLLPRTNP